MLENLPPFQLFLSLTHTASYLFPALRLKLYIYIYIHTHTHTHTYIHPSISAKFLFWGKVWQTKN